MPFGGLLTVGLISAGAGLAGAAIQSHQQGKAVDAQKEAGDKALALQKDIYNQQQANEAPWRNTGASAITTLGGLLGLPSGGGGSTGQLPTNTLGSTFDPAITPGQANFANYSPTGGYIGKNVPMSEQMSNPAVRQDASGYTAQQHGASPSAAMSPMLRVRAPNGNVYTVPADKAAEAQQNGGTVLGTV